MLHVSCSKFSQLSNSEKSLKIFQQFTKLPSAMQCLPFLHHPAYSPLPSPVMLKQLGTETHRYETVGLGSLVSYAQYLYGAKIAKQSDAGL